MKCERRNAHGCATLALGISLGRHALLTKVQCSKKDTSPTERSLTVSTIDRTAFVGSYLPRQCGIATFTTDLCKAIARR